MKFLKYVFSCGLVLFVLVVSVIATRAQSTDGTSASISSVELFPYDDVGTFSNDLHYSLNAGVGIITDMVNNRWIINTDPGATAGWSIDSATLAYEDGLNVCMDSQQPGNLILFHANTQTITRLCYPFGITKLAWSPFAQNYLAINNQFLIDVSTGSETSFSPPANLQSAQLETLIGHGKYLWDPATEIPVATINLNKLAIDRLITRSVFEACPLAATNQCLPIVDTLAYAEVDAFGGTVRKDWLLWGGHVSPSGLPYSLGPYGERSDTIVYLTSLATGETQELYRFSSAQINDAFVTGLGWSPDGNTVTLLLTSKDRSKEDMLLLPDAQGNPTYKAGTLVLHLSWSANGTTTPTFTPTSTPETNLTLTPTTTSTPSSTSTATNTPTATSTNPATATLIPGTFPATGILDDFNRANGNLGSNWSGAVSGYSIASNQMDVGVGDAIYWSPSSFGADQEAFVKLVNIDPASSEVDLLLKTQSNAWGNGVIEVWYSPSSGKAQVWTYTSSQNWVQRGADIPVTFAAGDQFGARAKANGTVEVYKNGTLLASRDVSAWPYNANGGSIGLWMIDSSSTLLDDFGGGNVTAATPTPTPTATITPTATATSTPLPGNGTGLIGQYYNNSDLTNWKLNRTDSIVDFNWGSGSPDASIGADTFSVRWTGQVVPQYSETYTFYTQSDDGVRLWVNNQLIIDNWTDHNSTENSGTIALTAGTRYNTRMEYYENTNGAIARLSWSSSSQTKQVIPTDKLLPNGRIVFQTNRDGNNEIYAMNADGSGLTNLTNNSASDQSPTAAVGIGKIVFASDRTGNYEIFSMELTGGTLVNLTNASAYDHYPSQAPDGRIVFASTRNGGNFNLWLMNANGSGLTQLTNTTGTERFSSWSPDGQWIVYEVDENGVTDLWKIPAAGGTPTRLTENIGTNHNPDWSPDGSTIVFRSTRSGGNYIYLMNVDGSNQRPFVTGGLNGFSPSWSPNGQFISYHAWGSTEPEIYTIPLGGTTSTRLTNDTTADQFVSWGAQ